MQSLQSLLLGVNMTLSTCVHTHGRHAYSVLRRTTTTIIALQAMDASEQYQLQKMRCLRDINADSNTVGWYQSAPYNDFQSVQLIETFISYDESVKKCVCIVCDTKEAARGSLALRALRLSKKFMELYQKNANVRASHLPAQVVIA